MTQRVRVAIVGGGIAGAATFRGLSWHAQLQVDIFEGAAEFRAPGAGINFNANAIQALQLLGLQQCLEDAGAMQSRSARLMLAAGEEAGQLIIDLNLRDRGAWTMQRAQFLAELLRGADTASMHTGKELIEIQDGGTEIVLEFADGMQHVCDVLLGADGVHSRVRKFVVGADHPSANPVYAGWQDVRNLAPLDKALASLGTEWINPEQQAQYGWIGRGGFIMHDILSNGKLVQCIGCVRSEDKWELGESQRPISKQELGSWFDGWDERLAKGMTERLADQEDLKCFSQWEHPHAPTFVKGGVSLVGDAAHAMTPWQASGAGMAMEDAFIIAALFEHVHSIGDAHAALQAYDAVRRPRTQRVVTSGHEVGILMSGIHPDVGLNRARLEQALSTRWDFIIDADLEQHRAQALKHMQELAVPT